MKRHRITITLTEEESAALDQVGERCYLPQDWLGAWRGKLVHRAFTAFLKLAARERINFPLRLEFHREDGDFFLESETIKGPQPVKPSVWDLFRRH